MALWLEDYSALKVLFSRWRDEGVVALRPFLLADPARVAACASCIRVLKVNTRTLELFEANDVDHLVANLHRVFRDDMLHTHINELVQLWDGHHGFFSTTVNYSLGGKRIDVQLKGAMLPGHEGIWDRVLVSTEDVTARETARRQAEQAEQYARGLFENSPVSLWVEDFSSVKALLDDVRARGISDFRTFTDVHPEFIERCMSEIRVLDVNRHTIELFGAAGKAELFSNLDAIFRDEMVRPFREQLIDLWDGKLFQQREVVNYALNGDAMHLHLQFSVLPGHERDWSLVQVALTDITARKKAEAYLEYLGKHDVLTRLYNRSFYADELNRLERKGPFPVTVIIIDLNNLKPVNDQLGHAAGDALLRRAGEVLAEAVEAPNCAARIGGDEFALLLPATGREQGLAMLENIEKLVTINNQFYSSTRLSFAMGLATSEPGERLEMVVKRADLDMYAAKRRQAGGPAREVFPPHGDQPA
ncbi:sensor domain-containing diguanylate cyclase [Ancylobacter sp. 6x-1]|uniref:Sensor domain-containing diguanylate cyclase n=2 Tax=Ancylobacter crimeensis TaxID=2579147 RepID=A0ABT0D7I4_9HYPH|nr:sensor domain-containing diguanylate cyclase [Ancylobacter crimeensis]MCK0195905.1 sensor domain-containing diguanylate cyclase [Ancylobacter crimeensis]